VSDADLLATDAAYDAWFRAKVQEALDDPRPPVPDEVVRKHFAEKAARLEAKPSKRSA
jgi:DNA-damage-inducible protein J